MEHIIEQLSNSINLNLGKQNICWFIFKQMSYTRYNYINGFSQMFYFPHLLE